MSKLKTILAAALPITFVILLNAGCTFNFVVDIESASGRDGEITETATDTEQTTPTVDMTTDVNGL